MCIRIQPKKCYSSDVKSPSRSKQLQPVPAARIKSFSSTKHVSRASFPTTAARGIEIPPQRRQMMMEMSTKPGKHMEK